MKTLIQFFVVAIVVTMICTSCSFVNKMQSNKNSKAKPSLEYVQNKLGVSNSFQIVSLPEGYYTSKSASLSLRAVIGIHNKTIDVQETETGYTYKGMQGNYYTDIEFTKALFEIADFIEKDKVITLREAQLVERLVVEKTLKNKY